MAEKNFLSTRQLAEVLDNVPIAIYVTAVDNRELLYTNSLARDFFGFQTCHGSITCYQAAGFERPCSFCKMEKMNRTDPLSREFRHPSNHRIYQLQGKIIDWGDRPAHIEYIQDITDRKKKEDANKLLKEELQATLSNIPCGLGVYQYDESGILPLYHNPSFYTILGYSKEHIQMLEETTIFLGVHPEDKARLLEKLRQAISENGILQYTYKVWNDKRNKYCFIHLEGAVRSQPDGKKLVYCVYSDQSEQVRLENELIGANKKMQDIINAIPGGVAIYKVSEIFQTEYFSDGVPELSGYTKEEYQELVKGDAAQLIHPRDKEMVVRKLRLAIQTHTVADFEFRKLHRNGHVVWVHIQAKQVGEEGGLALLQCVFHNISILKDTQMKLDHLINSIPGGIASYQVEDGRFLPTYFSDGVMALTGHTREEYKKLVRHNALDIIYEPDKARVFESAKAALLSGGILDVSYRMRHKDGSLIWIHLNGRRMDFTPDKTGFYAVFTGMSAETRLFQSITNETADGIFVIDKTSYELLYVNESSLLFKKGPHCVGQKCYKALHGKSSPCSFCPIHIHGPDGTEHEIAVDDTDRFYTSRLREIDWNGIPAYVQYIRDVTEEVKTRKEKERLAMYFQTVVENLPGGISVIRCGADGCLEPEYISDGLAEMLHTKLKDVEKTYSMNVFSKIHPEDLPESRKKFLQFVKSGEGHCELTTRLQKADGGYIWVKCALSLLRTTDGIRRLYSVYTDVTKAVEEKELLRRQYEDIILQHYRKPGSDEIILGHCNISQNQIFEIIDQTNSNLLHEFGSVREDFFIGLSGLVVEEQERQQFLEMYLNAPALAAFQRNETELLLNCFIKLPTEKNGRYVKFKVNLVEMPDTGDIVGILTVQDITAQTISDRILHQLSVTSYDYVIDLDLEKDTFTVMASNKKAHCIPPLHGSRLQRVTDMAKNTIVPRDRHTYSNALSPDEIRRRLSKEGSYTFAYSLVDEWGDIRTKNMTVSAIDLRLGRVCLVCTDITDSVREQQGLLHMIAYTFELAAFIQIGSGRFTMYTRDAVLHNLSPAVYEDYNRAMEAFSERYGLKEDKEEVNRKFLLSTLLQGLMEKPNGYDFVFPYRTEEDLRYKQINVLWGDQNHRTICLVRADVTDMLAAERQTKKSLEKALAFAEEANRAKSDFLSAMSHDIRTPMNAIMGMTTLAIAHIDDQNRVKDCLQKITIASRHLLSLINDVLDMSKLDGSKILLNSIRTSLPELVDQLSAMMDSQAKAAGLNFTIQMKGIHHPYFFGDALRINQILINLLSNAVKFTPAGGTVQFLVEEQPCKMSENRTQYRFTVRDTGIGMPPEFLAHIFEPFARSRTASHIEGTGLGLSIIKRLVDFMDGEISVESHVNQGTTFCVELEFMIAPPQDAFQLESTVTEAEEKEKMFAGRCFLVAEDNRINAEILSELLQMYGAKSVIKTDGLQVVQAFQMEAPGTFDAVLMDIQMPQMNGYEATCAIRKMERPDAKSIPIVAMTANAFAEDIRASLNAGMTAHIAKPIDMDVLQATLKKALETSKNSL